MREEYEWRTGRSVVFRHFVHLIFVTKYRRDVFTKEMLDRLADLFRETCAQMQCELVEFGGEEDHVHLMVSVHPKLSIASLVGKLKGKSAYFLRREFWPSLQSKLWGVHLWSPSYCVVSSGGAPLEILRQYIEQQREPPSEKGVAISRRETGRKRQVAR